MDFSEIKYIVMFMKQDALLEIQRYISSTRLHSYKQNAIDLTLTAFVNGADWMTTLPFDNQTLHKITEVKNRLKKQNKQITHDRIVSELTL